ncbi:tetratricopeptide repeat protein [Hymenobacter caeli]|uniref:Tetratricopeptide (TPR) repeat protein n=1 Tax=Hymenobacter caeli TaxID=2735894 RepID=A0ABX2FMC3_9BACT|nr:tetratricopeptide repeat protein [Hymenobacter caeli]NRT17973.1 tetratricopeptide (TPR) repeat protein [Hymenobacter caeli]
MRAALVGLILLLLPAWAAPAQSRADSVDPPGRSHSSLSRQERRAIAKEQREANKTLVATQARQAAAPPLSERDREMSEALFVDGVKYVLLEDYPKALDRLGKAYAFSPTNAALNYKIAEASLLSGNLRDATSYATAAVRLDPKNAYYYLLLAQAQATQKQYDAATHTYAALVKEVPNSGGYLFNLTDLYLAQGKLPEALSTLAQAEQQFGASDEVSFKKQQIYLKQNKLDLALAEGEKLMAANPDQPRYVLAQAELYGANNRVPDAIRLGQQALKLDPGNAAAHLLLADAYRQQKNVDASEKEVRQAFDSPALDIDNAVRILANYVKQLPNPALNGLALDLAAATVRNHPKEAKAYTVAGDVQTLTERKREARDSYLKALKYDNSHFQVWQQVVLLDAELSQNDSLLVHSDRALELFPNQAPLWFFNGTGLLLKKQPQRAVAALEHGRKLAADTPELLAQFDSQLGDAYHALKDYEKSDAAYDAALALDANNWPVLNNYSYYLALRGQKLDKAREMAARVVKQFPARDTYLDTYAWVLYKQKDYAGARTALETALKTTKDASVLEHYGDVLYQLGDHDQALAAWQRARKAGPGASEFLDRKIRDHKLYE